MQYYSTRNHAALFSLQEAAFRGLAPDGGLFMPAVIPHADLEKVRELSECSFSELSRYLTRLFFGDELPEARTDAIAAEACRFPVPLKQVGKDKYTLELFHGPTFAFKDIGAGFMGHALRALNRTAEETIILTATSGDTGSAVANGFYGIEGVKVVILYPDGQVSGLQESQMTTLGGNIFPLKVKGTFDDCQRIVKDIFSDADFRREKRVTSANSINILRWIPQSFYYFHGWAQWVKATGRNRRAERQLRKPRRRTARCKDGVARETFYRRSQRERHRPEISPERPFRTAAVGTHGRQRNGRRQSEQLRTHRRPVRQRLQRRDRSYRGIFMRRPNDPGSDPGVVRPLRLPFRSAQCRGI